MCNNPEDNWKMSDIKEVEFTNNDIRIYLSNGNIITSPISRFNNLNNISKDKLSKYIIKSRGINGWSIELPEIGESLDSQDFTIDDE